MADFEAILNQELDELYPLMRRRWGELNFLRPAIFYGQQLRFRYLSPSSMVYSEGGIDISDGFETIDASLRKLILLHELGHAAAFSQVYTDKNKKFTFDNEAAFNTIPLEAFGRLNAFDEGAADYLAIEASKISNDDELRTAGSHRELELSASFNTLVGNFASIQRYFSQVVDPIISENPGQETRRDALSEIIPGEDWQTTLSHHLKIIPETYFYGDFPYILGYSFFSAIGGKAEMKQILHSPPPPLEEFLYPEKYIERLNTPPSKYF